MHPDEKKDERAPSAPEETPEGDAPSKGADDEETTSMTLVRPLSKAESRAALDSFLAGHVYGEPPADLPEDPDGEDE